MVKRRPKSRPVRVSGALTTPRDSSTSESIDDEMFAALASIPRIAPVLMKVCRLCETKDGPFLNIFDADKATAKRIDEVLPFTISENDELPHKICFRCSAKIEELYEFILKCIKTQESLQSAVGKRTPVITKSRFRVQWEKQLNKKNISNDDICNALIKKAMEGIKDIPINPSTVEGESIQMSPLNKKSKNIIESPVTLKKDTEASAMSSKSNKSYETDESVEPEEVKLKQMKLALEKCDDKVPLTRGSRSTKSEGLPDSIVEPPKKSKQYPTRKPQSKVDSATAKICDKPKQNNDHSVTTIANKDEDNSDIANVAAKSMEPPAKVPEPASTPPPINIMDHVSIIKVNNVGTLFLCKLCNMNFLKKELVLTHGCAKNNVPKGKNLHNHVPPREVPKPSTVKYIKMDRDFKKPVNPPVTTENKAVEKKFPSDVIKVNIPVQPDTKSKVKIGPASKVKNLAQPTEISKESTPPPAKPIAQENKVVPQIKFPTMPSLNSRYKLIPGPNNTFTLMEDASLTPPPKDSTHQGLNKPGPKSKRKRKHLEEDANQRPDAEKESSPEVIELDNDSPQPAVIQQPYPVGLFQTAHHSGGFAPSNPKPPLFTTPAMKKQSYTIVQTGNPSKLLISTKPQADTEETQRKKPKKNKPDAGQSHTEPYNITVGDNSQTKDAGFFTFINVDPLLQPSYVLPTDNIIQESQISTSTPASKLNIENKDKDKYSCNMCDETFSREKKLLTHIQSHFNRMDEEDQLRREKSSPKKKLRKSLL